MIQAEFTQLGLPDAPGVYFFMAADGSILYIGRATSLRDRVRSYFSDDLIKTRGLLLVDMVTQAKTITHIQTDSVLEAILLEASEIKKYQPPYNTKEKDDKSFNYIIFTKEAYPIVELVRGKDFEQGMKGQGASAVFGPYTNPGALREGLKLIRRIFPFRDKRCVPGQGKPCFNRQIGLCPGCCTGEISSAEYKKQLKRLALFLEGKKSRLIAGLESDMMDLAKAQRFEEAGALKRTIFSLKHIQDVSVIKEEVNEFVGGAAAGGAKSGTAAAPFDPKLPEQPKQALFRIEAYDNAHTAGTHFVGVMTVLENSVLKKADYRMFKIRVASGGDDIGALREVLRRRLAHAEWTYPNIIVIDGGKAQKQAAEEVLKELNFDIEVVSVVKDNRHRPHHMLGNSDLAERYKKEILLLNNEAHRFAIKYHRNTRGAGMKLPK